LESGTSEWSAVELEEAFRIARENHLIPPAMEQPQYNLFHRARVEREYLPLYEKYGLGTTIWSPLASGVLTGKYNHGIPPGSRFARHEWVRDNLDALEIEKVKKFGKIAEAIDSSPTQLAIAWCLLNPHVSTVILGVSTIEQLEHNLKAEEVAKRITPEIIQEIEKLFHSEA
jgi:aryl-alcohol dehydrogenase-like predicted oxidoreductase